MNLAQRALEDFLVVLVDLDLLAIVENLERRAFPDTLVEEAFLVLMEVQVFQDNRD